MGDLIFFYLLKLLKKATSTHHCVKQLHALWAAHELPFDGITPTFATTFEAARCPFSCGAKHVMFAVAIYRRPFFFLSLLSLFSLLKFMPTIKKSTLSLYFMTFYISHLMFWFISLIFSLFINFFFNFIIESIILIFNFFKFGR